MAQNDSIRRYKERSLKCEGSSDANNATSVSSRFPNFLLTVLSMQSQLVSRSALFALRPRQPQPGGRPRPPGGLCGLSARGRYLVLLMAVRAQRPLYLTAGGLVRLSRELWLEVHRLQQPLAKLRSFVVFPES